MILEVSVDLGLALVVRAQQPPLPAAHLAHQELGAGDGGIEIPRLGKRPSGVGQGTDHQGVPAGDPLVVEGRPCADLASRKQPLADALPDGLRRARATIGQDVQSRLGKSSPTRPILEVPLLGGSQPGNRRRCVLAQQVMELRDAPYIEASLHSLGVRVQGAVKAPLGTDHLPQGPLQRVDAHRQQLRVTTGLPAVQVGPGEQTVVVEHLLEVGRCPGLIDAVPVKPPAKHVVDAACRHRPQGAERHLALGGPLLDVGGGALLGVGGVLVGVGGALVDVGGGAPVDGGGVLVDVSQTGAPRARTRARAGQQKLEHTRLRKLRGATESAVSGVEALPQPPHGPIEGLLVQGLGGGSQQGAPGEALPQALSARSDLLAPLTPRLADRLEHLGPRGHPVAGLRGKVGAAVEGQLLGREKDVQRPTPMAGHALNRLHVEGVHVRALLPVDLHAHEPLVHDRRGALVGEGLALHHVTPVTGRVPDRDQQRLVLHAGPLERDRSPGQPVDRVLGVLAQVGRGLPGERVRHVSQPIPAGPRPRRRPRPRPRSSGPGPHGPGPQRTCARAG